METNPAIVLFLMLGIIIAASRVAGALARQFGQPRVLGELLIGVILGPTLLNILHMPVAHNVELEPIIKHLAELGVLLLMFIIGLEVELGELARVGRVAVFAGFGGTLMQVLLAIPIVVLYGYGWQPALFAGVTLAATSVSISAQVLLELGFLRTKVGNGLLATALVDDILAILFVSMTIAITGPQGTVDAGSLIGVVARMVLYMGGAFLLAWFVLPPVMNWIADHPRLSQSYGIPAFALVFVLLFAWSAEELGDIAAITGAFIAGIGMSRTNSHARHMIEEATGYIAYAFLVPVFFVSVGLETNLRALPLSALPLGLLLLLAAVGSKVIGCGFGARAGGFSRQQSLEMGVCMISRGEMSLIIASLGVTTGVFDSQQPLFASLFLVVLLTAVLAPPLVRLVFKSEDGKSTPTAEEGSAA